MWAVLLAALSPATLSGSMTEGSTPIDPSFVADAAAAYGAARPVVKARPDGTILCEAEEFGAERAGWRALKWGANYYCATLANTFLSRKAFLSAPAQCGRATASRTVEIARAGKYLALVRYEAVYRFETRFTLRIEQRGRIAFKRLYGARENVKIWALGERLEKEVAWSWGATENIVWEGHDAFVDLEPGPARITLIADRQRGDAARRNVDLVLLTTDIEQVRSRIEHERYLPLDGMLTQAGDVYLRLHNIDPDAMVSLTIHPGREHSPYWVHQRA